MHDQSKRVTVVRLSRRLAAVITAVAILGVSLAGAAEPLSIEEIKSRLRAQSEKLESLYVELQVANKPLVDPAVFLSWPSSGQSIVQVEREIHFAFKGENRYWRRLALEYTVFTTRQPSKFFVAKSIEGPDSTTEQARQNTAQPGVWKIVNVNGSPDETRATNGKMVWERSPDGQVTVGDDRKTSWRKKSDRHVFSIHHPQEPGRGIRFQMPGHLFYAGIRARDPHDPTRSVRDGTATEFLPDLLERWSCTVSRQEEIDGTACVVLEGSVERAVPKRDPQDDEAPQTEQTPLTVWLDPEHGLAVRQKEVGGPNPRRMVNSKFEEVLPGFWLPKESELHFLAPPDAPDKYRGRPVRVTHSRVTRFVVNKVPDDLFDLPAKPGDTVNDYRASRRAL